MRHLKLSTLLAAGVLSATMSTSLLASTGCSGPFKMKDPPTDFAEVEAWDGFLRMKAGDDVGLNVRSFDNVDGGTLAYWSEDMVEKLGRRGYILTKQSAVESRNGVVGTRFDFDYASPTTGEAKFYTAILFVSDQWRIVVQLAGDAEPRGNYAASTKVVLEPTKAHICKVTEKTCDGPQPANFVGKLATGEDSEVPMPIAKDETAEG